MKRYHQKSMVKYVWTEKDIRIHFFFRLLKINLPLAQLITKVDKYLLRLQSYGSVFRGFTVIIWCFILENS